MSIKESNKKKNYGNNHPRGKTSQSIKQEKASSETRYGFSDLFKPNPNIRVMPERIDKGIKERNKKQDKRKKEINKAAKKFKVGGGGADRYGPHKVDVNRRATEALLGKGRIQEKIIKFADKFNKKQKEKKKKKSD